ncbi:MAG: LysE family translocator [Candidatus Bathyarchaeota archaeon]|nr:LysE family translocator [Candidatus Bathyarchaeota archaeon]
MPFIYDFPLFLISIVFISLSGVLLPGPLFAVTVAKAVRSKTAGAIIALGHGIVEFPLIFLLYFGLNQFTAIPEAVHIAVGLVGGLLMMLTGVQAFRNRNRTNETHRGLSRDSIVAGAWTTAANAGFILWWLTIGLALIMNAKLFGLLGFSIFAVVHWLCDFAWYTLVAVLIFKSQRFWTKKMHQGITFFCVAVFLFFGAWFFSSALWQAIMAVT